MIKILAMDVDGTMTDGKIYIGNSGEEFKAFNVQDGYGIKNMLSAYGIIPVIITARRSKIVENRARELDIIEIVQGCQDKIVALQEVAAKYNVFFDSEGKLTEVAYFGDDIPDIGCMRIAGACGCPANAVDEVKKLVHFVGKRNGGDGAVREFIEWLLDEYV